MFGWAAQTMGLANRVSGETVRTVWGCVSSRLQRVQLRIISDEGNTVWYPLDADVGAKQNGYDPYGA